MVGEAYNTLRIDTKTKRIKKRRSNAMICQMWSFVPTFVFTQLDLAQKLFKTLNENSDILSKKSREQV